MELPAGLSLRLLPLCDPSGCHKSSWPGVTTLLVHSSAHYHQEKFRESMRPRKGAWLGPSACPAGLLLPLAPHKLVPHIHSGPACVLAACLAGRGPSAHTDFVTLTPTQSLHASRCVWGPPEGDRQAQGKKEAEMSPAWETFSYLPYKLVCDPPWVPT